MSSKKSVVYLIRHAHAGQRDYDGHDIYRPLSKRGRSEAKRITEALVDVELKMVLSSPATRCVQTVEALAKLNSLDVAEADALWEDALATDMLDVLESLPAKGNVAVCSHGNLIPEVIELLANRDGIRVNGRGCEKGSVWELHRKSDSWVSARYLGAFKK
jgi:phosphohistidine phosphatase SixA